jgi:hypothetical protein
MRTKVVSLMALLVCVLAVGAYAQGSSESVAVLPNEIVWKSAPVSPGPDIALLYAIHRSPTSMSSE